MDFGLTFSDKDNMFKYFDHQCPSHYPPMMFSSVKYFMTGELKPCTVGLLEAGGARRLSYDLLSLGGYDGGPKLVILKRSQISFLINSLNQYIYE